MGGNSNDIIPFLGLGDLCIEQLLFRGPSQVAVFSSTKLGTFHSVPPSQPPLPLLMLCEDHMRIM